MAPPAHLPTRGCIGRLFPSSNSCSGAAPNSNPTIYVPYKIAFDVEKLTWELNFFVKHFLEGYRGISLSPAERAALDEEWAAIATELESEPRVLCHRDYHSRNLMFCEGSLYIIDFQDARMGPDTYDLVSLLRDSYVDLTEPQIEELTAYFLALKGSSDGAAFRRRFDLMALQRNLKALGTFGYQTLSRQNPVYIQYVPRTLNYARANLNKYRKVREIARDPGPARRRVAVTPGRDAPARYNGEFPVPRIFGVSTHLYHGQRLTRDHLLEVGAQGFERLELFATRTHFDYHSEASIAELAGWLVDAKLELHSVHAPVGESFGAGRWGPLLTLASPDADTRRRALDETERALQMARRIPFRVLVVHLGVPKTPQSVAGENSRDAARRSVEALQKLAEPLGVTAGARGHPERPVAPWGAGALCRESRRRRADRHLPRFRARPHGRRPGRRHRNGVGAPDYHPCARQ